MACAQSKLLVAGPGAKVKLLPFLGILYRFTMCTLQGEALKLGFARFKTSADGLDLFFIAELSACGRDGIWPASRENPSYRRQKRK